MEKKRNDLIPNPGNSNGHIPKNQHTSNMPTNRKSVCLKIEYMIGANRQTIIRSLRYHVGPSIGIEEPLYAQNDDMVETKPGLLPCNKSMAITANIISRFAIRYGIASDHTRVFIFLENNLISKPLTQLQKNKYPEMQKNNGTQVELRKSCLKILSNIIKC